MKKKNQLYIDESKKLVVMCIKTETFKSAGSFTGIVIASHNKIHKKLDWSCLWSSNGFTPFEGDLIIYLNN